MLRLLPLAIVSLFFLAACTSEETITTATPAGYSAPVPIASITAPVDNRSWEEKAEAAMQLAEPEAAPAVAVTPPVKPIARVKAKMAHGKRRLHKKWEKLAKRKSAVKQARLALQ